VNRSDRQAFLDSVDVMVARIVRDMHTWEDRWGACAGCMQALHSYGRERGLSQEEIIKEIGGELARRLIVALGSPPIADINQSLIYLGSNWVPHKMAAQAWAQKHPEELQELQRQHPDIPLLAEIKHGGPTGRYIEAKDGGEAEYFVNLRQALYILGTADDPTAPMIALRTWMRGLYKRFCLGGLRATSDIAIEAQPHDTERRMVEVTALYLKGRLTPADTGTEIALADELERLNAEHGEVVQMLFTLAGRST
jgi:hypothetical protein